MDHEPSGRRSFLAWATTGLGALFTAILGAPVVAYVIDPRNRQSAGGDFRVVDGVLLKDLKQNTPVQGVLKAVRRDGWTLHPSDVIGRVWIVLTKPVADADQLPTNDPALLHVFTTICPHLGCSVNENAGPPASFTCPCHGATFNVNGTRRAPAGNPAARDMDSLEWKIDPDPANPGRQLLLVKYVNFKASIKDKLPLAG